MPRGVVDPTLKDRLLDQARVLLRRGGPGDLTARALAQETGVSVGVLYNHFSDMNSVLLEVVAAALSESAARVADRVERCASSSVESLLVEVGRVMLDDDAMAIAHAVFARPDLAERVGRELAGSDRPILGQVEDLIEGELNRRSPGLEPRFGRTAARLFVGLIHDMLQFGPEKYADGEIDAAAQLIANGLSAALSPRRPRT